jgi:hypothetical protein
MTVREKDIVADILQRAMDVVRAELPPEVWRSAAALVANDSGRRGWLRRTTASHFIIYRSSASTPSRRGRSQPPT